MNIGVSMILKVLPIEHFDFEFIAPSSKSYTHRAIIIAGISKGRSYIHNPLISEDTLASLNAIEAMGCEVERVDDGFIINGIAKVTTDNSFKNMEFIDDIFEIDLANSGTSLRLLTSIFSLMNLGDKTNNSKSKNSNKSSDDKSKSLILTGDDSLKTRPMEDLIKALERLGASFEFLNEEYKAPFKIKGGFIGGRTYISGSTSSQFISSILISSPISKKGTELIIKDEFVSKPYVDITLDVMKHFNVDVDYGEGENTFKIRPQQYIGNDYYIEGDYSSSSYFLALPGVIKGKIRINNLYKGSKQGDRIILNILSKMGLEVKSFEDYVEVSGEGELKGINIDLNNAPDLLPTVAVLGALANGETKITGVKHARVKETDRIKTCCSELSKLGCELEELEDGLIIKGKSYNLNKYNTVESHNDHRLAMAFTLFGLKHGIMIENAEAFNVSFPNFKDLIEEIGAEVQLV